MYILSKWVSLCLCSRLMCGYDTENAILFSKSIMRHSDLKSLDTFQLISIQKQWLRPELMALYE